MTKKVLGSDPFANAGDANEGAEPARASKRPSAKASKRPSAKASKRPSAKASERPSAKAAPKRDSVRAESPIDHVAAAIPAIPAAPKTPRLTVETASLPVEAIEPARAVPAITEAHAEVERANAREPVHPSHPAENGADDVGADAAPGPTPEPDDERPSAASTVAEPDPTTSVEDKIRDLEAQLDVLLSKAGRERVEPEPERDDARAEPPSSSIEVHAEDAAPLREDPLPDVAADLVSSEYYTRQWGRVALRDRAEEVDEFGLDHEFSARAKPVLDALYERWWRVQTQGIENVPSEGRVILCANHAGAVPYDGLMLATALRREHPARRTLRWLADDFVFHFPFMGVALNRLGAVRACQENAERLLRGSNVVGVFPEGVKGVSKSYRERYQLQRFGRGGHVKLALRTRTPIVPVAIVGSEETHPMLPTGPLAKLLNVPFLPLTPTFPFFGPLGLLPLPSKWSITFLPAIPVDGYEKDAADDELLVGRLNEKLRASIQDELSRRTRERRSIFKG